MCSIDCVFEVNQISTCLHVIKKNNNNSVRVSTPSGFPHQTVKPTNPDPWPRRRHEGSRLAGDEKGSHDVQLHSLPAMFSADGAWRWQCLVTFFAWEENSLCEKKCGGIKWDQMGI